MTTEDTLMRLIKARRDRRLAEEAQLLAETEEQTIEPADSNLIAQANSLNTPEGPLGNPSFWSKVGGTLEKLAYPGEVGAGLLFQAFDKDARERRRQLQEEKPGDDLKEFFTTSRDAYKEKNLPLWQSLPLEIVADPLTYIPLGLISKAAKGKKAMKAIGSGDPVVNKHVISSYEELAQSGKRAVDKIGSTAGDKGSDFVRKKGGPIKVFYGAAKGQSYLLDPKVPKDRILLEKLNTEKLIPTVVASNTAKLKNIDNVFADNIDELGIVRGTGDEAVDGKFWAQAFEDVFDVQGAKKGSSAGAKQFDQVALNITRKRKAGPMSWPELLAKDVKAIRNYKVAGKPLLVASKLKDEQIQEIGKFLYTFGEHFDDALDAGLDISSAAGRGGFVPRNVLSGLTKAITDSTRAFKDPSFMSKRKYTSEMENELVEEILAGNLKYATEPSSVYQKYAENSYLATNNASMQQKLQRLAAERGQGVAWKPVTENDWKRHSKVSGILNKYVTKGRGKAKVGAGIPLKGKQITQKDISDLRKFGYSWLAKLAKEDPSDMQKIIDAKKGLDDSIADIGHGSRIFTTGLGRSVPAKFNQLFFTGKNAEKEAKRWASLTGIDTDKTFTRLAVEGAGKVGDVMRVAKTGFDFGFMLLQGLPMLGRAFTNPSLYNAWGKATFEGFKVFFQPEQATKFIKQMGEIAVEREGKQINLIEDYALSGGQLGKLATDIYAGVPTAQRLLDKVPILGKPVGNLLERFEGSFVHSGEVLRLKSYQYMRNTIYRNAPEGQKLQALADYNNFLNKATGALDPIAAGIPPSQQAIERSIALFSPRYTRSSFSLMADVFRGGIQGAEARATLLGLAGTGMGFYITTSLAMGQEPQLDPTSSRFMTWDINGNRIGIGSFWISFARAAVKLGDSTISDEDIMEEQRDNPIFQYLRGRTSPVTSLAYDIYSGRDFLGRPFENRFDIAAHIGKSFLPFSVEGALMDEGYKTNSERLTGLPFEQIGMRVRPSSIWERRYQERNDIAHAEYGQLWTDINRYKQKELIKKYPSLQELDAQARKAAAEGGSRLVEQIETYYQEQEKIKLDWDLEMERGIAAMQDQWFNPRELREVVLKRANTAKRVRYKDLNKRLEPEGDLEDVNTYFTQMADKFSDETQPEDIAYREFLTEIIGNPDWDKTEGYDWLARDAAIEDFKEKWGSDIFDYVELRVQQGQEIPDIITEYYNARRQYEYYWEATEKAVIQQMPFPEVAQLLRTQYINATDSERLVLKLNPELKKINSRISGAKRALRQMNQGIDAFLYRWGYADTLIHPENKGEEWFWNKNEPIDLAIYETGPNQLMN